MSLRFSQLIFPFLGISLIAIVQVPCNVFGRSIEPFCEVYLYYRTK